MARNYVKKKGQEVDGENSPLVKTAISLKRQTIGADAALFIRATRRNDGYWFGRANGPSRRIVRDINISFLRFSEKEKEKM